MKSYGFFDITQNRRLTNHPLGWFWTGQAKLSVTVLPTAPNAAPGPRRSRRYAAEDVERLLERKRLRRDPDRAGERSLAWGTPVVESAICLIDRGRLFYRGHDATALAETAGFEEVAALLWTGDPGAAGRLFSEGTVAPPVPLFDGPGVRELEDRPQGTGRIGALERCQAALALAGAADPAAWDPRPAAMATTGARVLRLVARQLAGEPAGEVRSAANEPIARRLARAWGAGDAEAAARVLSSTLVLCADHELNVSAFTARCVASAEATLYDAVAAGLAALKGRRHGGVTERVAALLRETGVPPPAGPPAGSPTPSRRRSGAGSSGRGPAIPDRRRTRTGLTEPTP